MSGVKTVDLAITRYFWVVTIAAFPAITAVEVNAGKDISKWLMGDSVFGADPSNTVNETDVTMKFDVAVPAKGKYKGSLHIFRAILPTGVAGTEDLLATFTGLPSGYLVRRNGPPATQAIVTGDVVEAAPFIADIPQQAAGATAAGFLKITVPLLPQGSYFPAITLT